MCTKGYRTTVKSRGEHWARTGPNRTEPGLEPEPEMRNLKNREPDRIGNTGSGSGSGAGPGVRYHQKPDGVFSNAVQMAELDLLLMRRFEKEGNERVVEERAKVAKQTKEYWESHTREPFNHLASGLEDARQHANANMTVMHTGKKCDLVILHIDELLVLKEQFAKGNVLIVMEAFARTTQNVEEAFINTTGTIYKKI
ncbi:LOW QUALITY PROTEIN: hypothetical protein OSB04_012480 [Centaurea solstitialis]|uniref:Uncharacterized protein n=1 Tax=Centaurea solstitialis TaxID=347529 RepID=A0AA38TPG7_9ASTR|nr:LOW QUALITY PROTEIN: hypothetical protein OSB04_012480 [Centaurea solstitialis]